jgi:hypothetical protein
MSIVFGIRSDMDNPRLAALNTSMEKFIKNIQPGVNIVDVFPALAKLPTFNGGGVVEIKSTRRQGACTCWSCKC